MNVALREKEIACGAVEKPRIAQEAPTDSTGRSILPDRFVSTPDAAIGVFDTMICANLVLGGGDQKADSKN
jgi:hypothetical protein